MKTAALFALPLVLASGSALAQPAESYQALGTEPFWSLDIGRNTISFRPADGRPVSVAKPRPIVGINGELYRARGMTVDITHVRCNDGMSDRTYRDTVKVTLGRRVLSGCGGAIVREGRPAAGLLAGTDWRIDLVDGRPVRLERPATVRFTADRIEGKICNGFGGRYTFARGRLTTREVIATQMACGGSLGATERAFFRLIGGRVTVSQGKPDTLVLSDDRNSITLRRVR